MRPSAPPGLLSTAWILVRKDLLLEWRSRARANALVFFALWALSSKTSELEGFHTAFQHFDWWWVAPAVIVEIASYFCFAAMQFELLKSGHLRAPWRPLVKLTFASQAITNSLPIGNAVASVYGFRWFRRFGADNTLAVWALAGTLVAATVTVGLGIIVAVPWLRHSFVLCLHGDFAGLRVYIKHLGAWGLVLLIGLMLMHAVIYYPTELVTATAGFVYGWLPGLAIVTVGCWWPSPCWWA